MVIIFGMSDMQFRAAHGWRRDPRLDYSDNSFFQANVDNVAFLFSDELSDIGFYGKLMCAISHRHERTPKNFAESGITTYVQPPFAGDFCSLALNCFFIVPPIVTNAIRVPPLVFVGVAS
jgi:hypothetical protein